MYRLKGKGGNFDVRKQRSLCGFPALFFIEVAIPVSLLRGESMFPLVNEID